MESPQEFTQNWIQHRRGMGTWDAISMFLAWLCVGAGTVLVILEFWDQPGQRAVPILIAGIAWLLFRMAGVADLILVNVAYLQGMMREKDGS